MMKTLRLFDRHWCIFFFILSLPTTTINKLQPVPKHSSDWWSFRFTSHKYSVEIQLEVCWVRFKTSLKNVAHVSTKLSAEQYKTGTKVFGINGTGIIPQMMYNISSSGVEWKVFREGPKVICCVPDERNLCTGMFYSAGGRVLPVLML